MKNLYCKLGIPYLKCLGPEVFDFFQILKYLHIHNEMC